MLVILFSAAGKGPLDGAAGFVFDGILRCILRARRLHLLAGFAEYRVGFLGGDWALDEKSEPIVAHFRGCGIVIDDGDRHCVSVGHGLSSPLQQEARFGLIGPVRDHAGKRLRLRFFDG